MVRKFKFFNLLSESNLFHHRETTEFNDIHRLPSENKTELQLATILTVNGMIQSR